MPVKKNKAGALTGDVVYLDESSGANGEGDSEFTFDWEEAFTIGHIPLDQLQKKLKSPATKRVQSINFQSNGYCTDAVLRCIATTLNTQEFHISLKEINLLGCSLVTDAGLSWLAPLLREKSANAVSISLDGCTKVTDSGLAVLKAACPNSQLSAMATSVVHMRYLAHASGCPMLEDLEAVSTETQKKAQVLVVPLKTEHSTALYLPDKTCSVRQPLHYVRETKLKDWTVNLLETDPETPLFQHLVSPNLTQVVIPFNVSCEPGEVRQHISNAISLALSKETVHPEHPSRAMGTTGSNFFFPYLHHMCRLSDDGTYQSLARGEVVLGMVVSRQPLSRSNPFFELELLLPQEKPAETGLVIGIMHDLLMSDRYPLESKESKSGIVEGFEFEPGASIGFGVEGEWLSEYVPSATAEFYYTKNGVKLTEKTSADKPHIGMYPVATVLGKERAVMRIKHFNSTPEELAERIEAKGQRHSWLFSHNMLHDENGVISYCDNYESPNTVGLFVTAREISRSNNTCTIKILNIGEKGIIGLGIGPEKYATTEMPGWRANSVGFHGDDGKIYHSQSSSAKAPVGSEIWKAGDEIKVVVEGFAEEYVNKGDKLQVSFYRNGVHVMEKKFDLTYDATDGIRCVFLLGMHSRGAKAQILNYRPLYLPISPDHSSLTMGRCHCLNIMDDGTLTYRKFDRRQFIGLYVSKTPFSARLPSFEIEITKMSAKKHVAVGLCYSHYPINTMLGWKMAALGYHADNGGLYYNSSSPVGSNKDELNEGDVVQCGIDMDKAKLKLDGTLEPQQTLTVYFNKNGKRVHSHEFEYLTDGIYPAVNLHFEEDEVKLRNYNPVVDSVRSAEAEKKKVLKQDASKEEIKPFSEGCHFLVVGVGSDGTDPRGKTQLIQQMFDAKSDLSVLSHVTAEIERIESNLGSLDLQAQQRYAELLWQQESLQRFIKSPQRISFHSLDTKKGEGHSELVDSIVSVLETDLHYHSKAYQLHSTVWEYLDKVVSVMKTKEILQPQDLYPLIDHSLFDCNGRVCEQAVRFLQNKGYFTCLPWKNATITLDMEFVAKLTDCVSMCPSKEMETPVPALGEGACVWVDEAHIYSNAVEYDPHRFALLRWVLQFFGVMRVPNIRTKITDPLNLFCTMAALGTAPVTLDDFKKEGEKNEKLMVMARTYHFLHSLTDSMLAFILTRCARSTQAILLRQNGGVFQSGATQTIIRKKLEGNKSWLTLESFCYLPSQEESEAVNQDIRSHITEYTWNVFCILADIIDVALLKLRIPVIVTDDCPGDLLNTSIGCIHNWHSPMDVDDRQTVCTLCNLCCEHNSRCPSRGMACKRLRQSACGTKVTGCKDCGICKHCADEIWNLRSILRPCCEVSSYENPKNQRAVQLNSTTFDEVTCTTFDSLVTPVCLKTEGPSESYIQVFPGPAVEVPNLNRLTQYNKETTFGKLSFKKGDTVTIKLDPLKLSGEEAEEEEEESSQEITPVYHTIICRESRVWHDTGIVCYETSSTSVPVSGFVGERPLSQECNRFSIEIINEGESRYVAIGLCHRRYASNRQPGWDSASIGYHADDGGIYLGAGWPTTRVAKCHKGDVMSCMLDFEAMKAKFFKNDTLVYTSNRLRIPAGGFYPCVGMHSVGEAVKLLQKEPWLPNKEDEVQNVPAAFDCYKYGNMWISPSRKVNLIKKNNKNTGWVMLYNPSRNTVGYQVEPLQMKNNLGTLKPGEIVTFYMQIDISEMPPDEKLTVKWLQLDSGREYTDDDLTLILQGATSESLLIHSLTMKVFNTQLTDVTELTRISEAEPGPRIHYKLEVFKNGISMDKYWLKAGPYSCVLPLQTNAILTYPKFPTLDRPNVMHRGMRLVAQISADMYAECVVVNVSADGQTVTLEYSEDNEEVNTQLEMPVSSPRIQLKEIPYETIVRAKPPEKSDDVADGEAPATSGDRPSSARENETEVQAALEILGYSPRGNMTTAKQAYMFVPFHLLSEASQQAIKALDPGWLKHSLQSVALCNKKCTRLTVQELQITALARKSSSWVNGNNAFKARIGETFAYLPSSLDFEKLCYPCIPSMFTDIDVHRLCMLSDQKQITGWQDTNIDEPIHFVDVPPIKPSQPLPDKLMYGCMLSGWTYTALVGKKLLLPRYDMIFSGGKPKLPRMQLESAMTSLLSIYTSLCHIYAEQCGGLEYEQSIDDGTKMVNSAIAHNDTHIKNSTGTAQLEDAHCLIKKRFYVASKTCYTVVCKAHMFSIEPVLVADDGPSFSLEYYEPYVETVNAFDRALHETEALPTNFFSKFQNIQVLMLQECDKLKQLPPEISVCHQLEKIVVKDSAVTSLPDDIFQLQDLMQLELCNLPLATVPTQFPATSWLCKLTLSGLQLQGVPPDLGNLTGLEELDLNYNLLIDLPMELSKLEHLRVLHLCGVPWLTMDGSQSSVPLDNFTAWCDRHPYLRTTIGESNVLKLFRQFDHNKNGMLDEDEIAALNVSFFWRIPRIGSTDINDEEYGGIPPVVFTLSALEELYLDYQAITAVPLHMCRLQNLAILSLAHNPLLESLPGSLGHLPSLKSIKLLSCPSLRTPPNEVVSRGVESVKAYLKRLAGGFTECRRTKLMFVGLGGAGKTSLLRALMSMGKKTQGTKGEDITDGIVIQPWTVKSDSGVEVTYSTWDFAGQTLYYNTHQFFLSKRAVYLLLWSTRQGFEHAGLDFWLSSVASHAPKTPIFVIGTHCDQVPQADIPMADLKERYPQIAGFHFVSSVVGTGIAELENDLLTVTLEQKNMGEKVPQVWLNLEKKILAARTSSSFLEWSVIKDYGMEVGIYDEKDTKEAIQFLHELGTVQYFDNDFLRNIVVINPQWIVNVMACVVSVKNSPIQDSKGRLLHKFIPQIWNSYPKELHKWLLQLTEEFDLTFPLPKDDVNIVPCLLPQEEPQEVKTEWPSAEVMKPGYHETKMVYKFAYLPAGLFNRAQVRLFQFSDGKLIWKRGSLLKKNKHLALIRQTSDCELLVKVQGPRPENIVFLVHEVIESLIEDSFHGVHYDFLLPCPDCISKEGTLDPSLFEGTLIKRAKYNRAPFLQCRKYFHTVSMAQLQDVMPAESATDFDAHLQHSIMSLQQMNSAMAKDVAILYSSSDIPSPEETDKVHPFRIKDDLVKDGTKEGYSCWFAEDIENTSVEDVMLALKNCKLVVALVSDNFERDSKTNDMLMYTMDTLNKDFVIVVIRPSLNWMSTNLGMRIGKDTVMVMIKTQDRYQQKQEDLLSQVKNKIIGIKNNALKPPVVFLSYAWSNSRDAQSKGTMCPPEALGWGDPREIKEYLVKHGITCWLDIEQTAATGAGLFQNIAQGMRQARILIACVSDEYVTSDNCMMELRFGVLSLNLPLIVCVVGKGRDWKESEIGILLHRSKASKVYFQQESDTAYDTLLSYVNQLLPLSDERKIQEEAVKQQMKELKENITKPDKTSFREEYELTQRKFMRHIISFVSSTDSYPLPRLVVLDFDKQALTSRHSSNVHSTSEDGAKGEHYTRPKSSLGRPGLRSKTVTRTRERMEPVNLLDDEENWENERFCVKLLCENEEGWHLCPASFSVEMTDDFRSLVRRCSAYLARLYAILQQSSMQLHCFAGKRGKKYREWIEENALENPNFIEAFSSMRQQLAENKDADSFLAQMCRCHLPSGKTYWLCAQHQDGPRITKLSTEGSSRDEARRVLFEEDIKFKELMENSPIYKSHKSQSSFKSSVVLPARVVSSIGSLGSLTKKAAKTITKSVSLVGSLPLETISAKPAEPAAAAVVASPTPSSSSKSDKGESQKRKASFKTAVKVSDAVASASQRREEKSGKSAVKSRACSLM